MNPIEFIRKNVVTQLVGEGFPEEVAKGGGRRGGGFVPQDVSGQPQGANLRRLPCSGKTLLPIPHTENSQRGREWKAK